MGKNIKGDNVFGMIDSFRGFSLRSVVCSALVAGLGFCFTQPAMAAGKGGKADTLNTYVKTTGEPKGVLITKAGSVKAPTSLNSNSLKSQIDSIDTQITRWQTKMSNQIDRYTTKFSRLEQLIAQMNSQASAMSGLMGGYSEY